MKRVYIKPEIINIETNMESLLAGESGGQHGGSSNPSDAKKHRFSFYDWDEEPDNSLPRSKSVWDD